MENIRLLKQSYLKTEILDKNYNPDYFLKFLEDRCGNATNFDTLTLNEIKQIVCGAPNVRAGLKVIVAKVGAELPGDVTIKRGMIRGQESNGMMCSLAELGRDGKFLTQADKEGICELGDDAVVGEGLLFSIQVWN